MTHFRSDLRAATAAAVIALVAAGACSKDKVPPPPPATTESPASAPPTERVVGPLSEADAEALATMNDRLKDYVETCTSSIEQGAAEAARTTRRRSRSTRISALFEKLMREARATAKPGDLFTPRGAGRSSNACSPPCSAGRTASS